MAMDPQIVFIHNEKTAGTSLRALLDRVYGRDQVVWRGRDLKSRKGKVFARIGNCRVVGGHLSVADFESTRWPLLFLSVVRDPLSRAVSLFNYFAEHAPEKDRKMWRWKGLRPESMKETIENVPAFRRAISNRQCYRLSGHVDFQAVVKVLEERNIIIGAFDHLDYFGSRVSDLLHWPEFSIGTHNRAPRESYETDILAEPELKNLVASLNEEDGRLHEFINSRKCYEHVPDSEILGALHEAVSVHPQ